MVRSSFGLGLVLTRLYWKSLPLDCLFVSFPLFGRSSSNSTASSYGYSISLIIAAGGPWHCWHGSTQPRQLTDDAWMYAESGPTARYMPVPPVKSAQEILLPVVVLCRPELGSPKVAQKTPT